MIEFAEVRLVAIEMLVDFTGLDGKWTDLEYLLDMAEEDPDPSVRFGIVKLLCENPPFHHSHAHRHRLDREDLVHRLWNTFK